MDKTASSPTALGRPPRKKAKKITESYLQNAGLYYLQRYAASRHQFMTVMMRKVRKSLADHPDQAPEACAALVEKMAARFEQSGLLNDEAYAAGLVGTLRRAGKSEQAIRAKLRIKGLETLPELPADHDYEAALRFAKKKKLGPYADRKNFDEKDFKKNLGRFARAGFSFELAQKILKATDEDFGI